MEIAIYLPLSDAQDSSLRIKIGGAALRICEPDESWEGPIVFGNPSPEIIEANTKLRWLQLESVGFSEYAHLDWMRSAGLAQVTNLAGFFADPVAETALAGILALGRGIDKLTSLRAAGRWVGDPIRAELGLLTGARVVFLGRGAINSRLSDLFAPFNCTVTAFGRDFSPAAFDDALAAADIVVATVPHTPITEGLFNTARIALLKPRAIFCNLGRGSVVDEEALAEALTAGRIAGAVIDVTQDEPLPRGHAFWSTPNTILTQHSAGGTVDEIDRKIDWFLNNFNHFRAGTPLRGTVDFTKGY